MKTVPHSSSRKIVGKKARLKSFLYLIREMAQAQLRPTNWIAGFCVAIGLTVAAWQFDPRSDSTNFVGEFDDPRSGVWWAVWDAHHLKRTMIIWFPSGTEDYEDLLSRPRRPKGYTIVDGVTGSYRYQTPDRQIPWWAWIAPKPQEFLGSNEYLILMEDGAGWPFPFAIRAYPESDSTSVSSWLVSIDRWPHVLNVNYGLWKIRVVSLFLSCAFFSICLGLIRFAMVSIRDWRRTAKGCCHNCGYSLEGLIGGPCPECGAKNEAAIPSG